MKIASGYEYAGVFQFVELWHAAFDVANATALNLTELKVTGAINYTFANGTSLSISILAAQRKKGHTF